MCPSQAAGHAETPLRALLGQSQQQSRTRCAIAPMCHMGHGEARPTRDAFAKQILPCTLRKLQAYAGEAATTCQLNNNFTSSRKPLLSWG